MKYLINIIFAIFLICNSIVIAQHKAITSEDFYKIKEITDFKISPDGKNIIYVLKKVDKDKNSYFSNLWLLPTNGENAKQLTKSRAKDITPCWSPDSKYIAFVTNRSGTNQVWLIAINGGEAWALTNLPNGAYSPSWSPNGTQIAFLSKVSKNENSLETNNIRFTTKQGKEYATDVKVINNLKYRFKTQYFDKKYLNIFIISVNGDMLTQLTTGDYNDSNPEWSPDSKFIVFSSNRNGDQYFDDNSDIFTVSSNGGRLKQLTKGPGPEYDPLWSPDGKYISFIGKSKSNSSALQSELFVININNKNITNLTSGFDRNIYKSQWSSKKNNIYFTANDKGNIHLFLTSINKKFYKKVIKKNRQLKSFQISSKNKIFFIATDNTNPGDLFTTNSSGKNEQQLTHINQNFLSSIKLQQPQEIFYNSFDNTEIHGWLMKPIHFTANKKYPLIIEIHGGPHWAYGNSWSHEFQILAAQGYTVFYCNPRQSTGYGQKFEFPGIAKWAVEDYQDIMYGINYVTKTGYIDITKMGITGGSYGGYMTNWILGHTKRFKAAVTQRSISNILSFYGTTDIQNFIESEFGFPWENFNTLYKHSPVTYTKNINTPLLIIHSELDYRTPVSQAEELFTLLKRNNVEVEFVRYPNEGHELSRSGQPVHRVDRYNRIIDWFNKHLK